MSNKVFLWVMPVVVVIVGQLALGFATASFNREMDEDIASLSERLKESGFDGKQAAAVDAAFRSTHYNVRNFVKDVCNWAIATITAVLVVALVGFSVRAAAGETRSSKDGQAETPD